MNVRPNRALGMRPSGPEFDMERFSQLVAKIEEQLVHQECLVVAISGFGGSGKSHLADRLQSHFGLKESQTIRLDHLYSQNPDGPGLLDQVDWPLLIQILDSVREGRSLHYVGRGFRKEALPVDEPLPRVVIVEGIRLLQPNLLPYFDIAIWMDCPQEIAMERAKRRDRLQGEDEETVSRWDTDWGPKDKEYFETYRPDRLATLLYPSR